MADMLYMQVANHILDCIQSGTLKEHDRISERKLAAEYNVSRTVVRESIKLLNERGLVRTVCGKGSFVNIPGRSALISKFEDALDVSRVKQEEVTQAREILEKAMVPLLISNTDEHDIEVLEELYMQMETSTDDGTKFAYYDERFHLAVSICSHNQVMSIMTGTLNGMTDRTDLLSNSAVRINANREHRKMIDALKKKDGSLLESALEKHISCIRHIQGEEEAHR
jgi:DNA-binding FadR family transcriptional regulator